MGELMSKQGEYAYSRRDNERAQDDFSVGTEQEVERLVGDIGSVIRAAKARWFKGARGNSSTRRNFADPGANGTRQRIFRATSRQPAGRRTFLNGHRCRSCFDCDARGTGSAADRIVARYLGRNHELGEGIRKLKRRVTISFGWAWR